MASRMLFTLLWVAIAGLVLLVVGLQDASAMPVRETAPPTRPETWACPSLPAPTGRTVEVSDEAGLWQAVNENVPGTTILVADGIYHLGQNGYYLCLLPLCQG